MQMAGGASPLLLEEGHEDVHLSGCLACQSVTPSTFEWLVALLQSITLRKLNVFLYCLVSTAVVAVTDAGGRGSVWWSCLSSACSFLLSTFLLLVIEFGKSIFAHAMAQA